MVLWFIKFDETANSFFLQISLMTKKIKKYPDCLIVMVPMTAKVKDSFKLIYYLGYITLNRFRVHKSSLKMFFPNHGLLLNLWNCRFLLFWSIHLWNWWHSEIREMEEVVCFLWSEISRSSQRNMNHEICTDRNNLVKLAIQVT